MVPRAAAIRPQARMIGETGAVTRKTRRTFPPGDRPRRDIVAAPAATLAPQIAEAKAPFWAHVRNALVSKGERVSRGEG
jgi:hypothetical protein